MEVVGSSYVMHDQYREGPYGWDSGRPAMDRQVDELGMYVEGDARKRKWNHEAGKRKAEEVEDEKEPKRTPPKKIFASVGEVGGSGGSSTSSHMSPGWQVNDIDLDLPGELSMNDALLSLPSLAVFKQEAPSPTGLLSPPRRGWTQRRHDERQQQNTGMAVDPAGRDDAHEHIQQQQHAAHTMATLHNGNTESMQCQPTMSSNAIVPTNGFHNNNHDNKSNGLLNICSPNNSLEGFLSPVQNGKGNEQSFKDDTRFQYVLAAATSIATKQHEESLTYLNQGQPYEIKLKKLGDLSHYKGKMLESIIKICFHERRLQYMERAAMSAWHVERPGVRVLEVDIPLSYGVTRATQPHEPDRLHTARVGWDPTKDVGVYIKVNCISTEFTAKKHGGEKGVPFRIQVETYLADDLTTRLHAAACQVKVFKLKGADRKHKQDREKLMRRPKSDFDKYQPGCEATVLTTLSNEAIMQSPPLISTSPTYSPEPCVSPKSASNALVIAKPEAALLSPSTQMKPMYLDNEMKVSSPPCGSPGAILPDLPLPTDDPDKYVGLCRDASAVETLQWLTQNRFTQHANTLANFSGADLLRLSRDDIIQICGLADGIRLFNALHAKRIEPRLTVYVCPAGSTVYHAVYLYSCRGQELVHKLNSLIHTDSHNKSCVRASVLVVGPGGARVRLSDELVRHLPDNSTYTLHHADHDSMLLTPTSNH